MKFGDIDINTLSRGFSKDYQSNFDSRLMNEFATAAYRVGHTLIPGLINMYSTVKNKLQVSLECVKDFLETFNWTLDSDNHEPPPFSGKTQSERICAAEKFLLQSFSTNWR